MGKRDYKVPRRNLVVLCFSQNICYVQVIGYDRAHREHGLEVNINKGTWTWQHETHFIGKARSIDYYKEGVIGVYNRAITQQLDAMVSSAQEVTRGQEQRCLLDDD